MVRIFFICCSLVAVLSSQAAWAVKGSNRDKEPDTFKVPTSKINLLHQFLTETLEITDLTTVSNTAKLEPLKDHLDRFFSPYSKDSIAEIISAFSQRRYANPFIIGEPGVGKSFLVDQLTAILSFNHVPDYIADAIGRKNPALEPFFNQMMGRCEIILVTNDLLSRNSGSSKDPFNSEELRIQKTMSDLFNAATKEYQRSGTRTIFVFDEAATLKPVVQNALLKPLERTGFKNHEDPVEKELDVGYKILPMTTPNGYYALKRGDPALDGRYKKILVKELSEEVVLEIMVEESYKHQALTKLLIDGDALEYLIAMRDILFTPPIAMPRGPLTALDELYTYMATRPYDPARTKITLQDARDFTIKKLGLPPVWLTGPHGEPPLYNLAEEVKKRVIGQDEAVETIAELIKSNFRLKFGDNPGILIVTGPSGSGKDTLYREFSRVLFGHDSSETMFSISGAAGFSIESAFEGPPIGNHSDDQPPLLLKGLDKYPLSFIGINEGKDAPPEQMAKLKVIFEKGKIIPKGRFAQTIPFRFPVWMMGQWGEELYANIPREKWAERFKEITQKDVEEACLHTDYKNGLGSIPFALIQRARERGAIIHLRPTLEENYAGIARIKLPDIANAIKKRTQIDIEITENVVEAVKQFAILQKGDSRNIGPLAEDFTTAAISRAIDKGLPPSHVKVRIDADESGILVYQISGDAVPKNTWKFKFSDLVRTKKVAGCDTALINLSSDKK